MTRSNRIEWERHDYYATWDDWSIARCVVDGTNRYTLWIGQMSRTRMPNRLPYVFDDAAEAVRLVRWIEDNAPEYQRDTADVELTMEQRELI